MRNLKDKFATISQASASANEQKKTGGSVVWTNGCFDLLHAGHVSYLEQARALGTLLIVGLNSDASVRRLKGSNRPLVNESARRMVLAALESVDLVVVFGEDTPLEAITEVQPDWIVKGGDYREEDVVGGVEARAWGGRVRIIPILDGWSTTKLANQLKMQP